MHESSGIEVIGGVQGCEILRTLNEGGMGKVYLARQEALNRLVCVKVLSIPAGEDPVMCRSRFYREAELLASVSHPHILSIFDFGTITESGLPFLVTEYIEGGDLRRCMTPRQPMPIGQARSLLLQVGEALAFLHSKGILHRDLKPENILMLTGSLVKVGDLGIAVLQEEAGVLTKSRRGMGTIGYVSPEQQYGLNVDERTDQYSLAALSYELLTGRRPLGLFPPPSHVNPRLTREVDSVILRGLSESPKDRFPDVREFMTALDRALASSSWYARNPRLTLAGSLAVLVVAAGLAWALGRGPGDHIGIEGWWPARPDPARNPPAAIPAPARPAKAPERSREFTKLVEHRAYAIWHRQGRPTGEAGEAVREKNWAEADRQIEDEVRARAYQIWVDQGRPTGAVGEFVRDKNWRDAEAALLRETEAVLRQHPIP
jgi:serine/threonine protein kinase